MSILIHGVSLPKNRAMVLVLNPNGNCVDEFGNAFAVDARPVKEGYWTDGAGNRVPWDEMNPDCPAKSAYCSVCGEWLTASDEYPAIGKYCPNCGADMRPEGGADG